MLLSVNIDEITNMSNSDKISGDTIDNTVLSLKNAGISEFTTHFPKNDITNFDFEKISEINGIKLNFEIPINKEFQEFALKHRPHACYIVSEQSVNNGLNVAGQMPKIISFIGPLLIKGIDVRLFINPELEQIEASANTGAGFAKLNSSAYTQAFGTEREETEFQKLKIAAEFAQKLHLKVIIGNDLNFENIKRIKGIENLYGIDIGHAIFSRISDLEYSKAILEIKALFD